MIFNEIFGKKLIYDDIKSDKKQSFSDSSSDSIFFEIYS